MRDWAANFKLDAIRYTARWDQLEAEIIDNYVNGDAYTREEIQNILFDAGFSELYQKCVDKYNERIKDD
jgi:hypothetical protein